MVAASRSGARHAAASLLQALKVDRDGVSPNQTANTWSKHDP